MIVNAPGLVLGSPANPSPNAPIIGQHSIVTRQNISASVAAIDGSPVTELANSATHLKWQSSTAAVQYLNVSDFAGEIDYVGIAGHNFGSTGAIVSIEGNRESDGNGDPGWFTIIPEFRKIDDKPILCQLGLISLASLRVKIQPNGIAPEASVLHVGRKLLVERNIYVGHTPITLGRRVRVSNGRSESGNFLGRTIRGRSAQTSVTLQNLTPTWYRRFFDPFVEETEEGCFFFAWRPADYPLEVGYCWMLDDPIPTNQGSNGMMQVNLALGGIIR
jgi:hypothetical protein